MKTHGGLELQRHVFLTLAQMDVPGLLHASVSLLPGKGPLVPTGQEADCALDSMDTVKEGKISAPARN